MTDTTYWPPQSKNLSNPDFIPPPTTGSNAIPPAAKGSAIGKCPFRKIYYIKNDTIEEDFRDCLGRECALWTPLGCKG